MSEGRIAALVAGGTVGVLALALLVIFLIAKG
jgi:hypothetical protein